jgi:ribonuclease-3
MLEAAVGSILEERKDQDAKSLLQEWSQARGFGAPIYHTVGAHGPDHDKVFEVSVEVGDVVYGPGSGHSKQAAAKHAARLALVELGLE